MKKKTPYTTKINKYEKDRIPLIVDYDVFTHFKGDANIAILYNNIRYWCNDHRDRHDETHFKDDKYWVWYSRKDLAEKFPMWDSLKIYRMLKKLVSAGFIVEGNFNKLKQDRTTWYSSEV